MPLLVSSQGVCNQPLVWISTDVQAVIFQLLIYCVHTKYLILGMGCEAPCFW